ncbi:MAG: hypothetical protein FWB72_02940 [Firmicutes bacterium]|nr:hypothetical protein [Bacillota bacterium]
MLGYTKKLIILSQSGITNFEIANNAVSGVAKLESNRKGVKGTLTLFNLKQDLKGEIYFVLKCSKHTFNVHRLTFPIGLHNNFEFGLGADISGHMAAGVFFSTDNDLVEIARGSVGNQQTDLKYLLEQKLGRVSISKPNISAPVGFTQPVAEPIGQRAVEPRAVEPRAVEPKATERQLTQHSTTEPDVKLHTELHDKVGSHQTSAEPTLTILQNAGSASTQAETHADNTTQIYNDEQIYTQHNFYDNYNIDVVQKEVAVSAGEIESQYSKAYGESEVALADTHSAENLDTYKNTYPTYYYSIKEHLDALFRQHEKVTDLEKIVDNSTWAKVNYDESGKYYIVGIVVRADSNMAEYICYGVPATHTKEAPRQLKGFTQWLPKDTTNPKGYGYWLMFQCAITGNTLDA